MIQRKKRVGVVISDENMIGKTRMSSVKTSTLQNWCSE